MTPAEIIRLETEFALEFPAEYRRALAGEVPYPVENEYADLYQLNRLWRDEPQWGFDWQNEFWCIGCPGIPGHCAIGYYFINCQDTTSRVHLIEQHAPAWSITDERRVAVFDFSDFVNGLRDVDAEAERQRVEKIEKLKSRYRVGFWRRLTGPSPPELPPAPDWMVMEVSRRTGISDSVAVHRILSETTAETAWAAAEAKDPLTFQQANTRDAFYGKLVAANLQIDPLGADDRFAAVFLRAYLKTERKLGRNSEGTCCRFWTIMQSTLAEDYGVDWKTPAQSNPGVEFC